MTGALTPTPIARADIPPVGTGAAGRPRVAIAGATGYAGQELLRLLARHPAATLTLAMSSGASSWTTVRRMATLMASLKPSKPTAMSPTQ